MIVCMTGGHGWALGHEADGPDAVRRAARTQIKAGADNVKLIASGGILSPGSEIGAPQFTVEEMRAAVEEAHAAGKICCAHAHGATAIKNAVKAGVNSVEHGYLLDDEGIQLMLDRGTYLVATSAAVRNVVKHGTGAGVRPDVVRKAQSAIDPTHRQFQARSQGRREACDGNRYGRAISPIMATISTRSSIWSRWGLLRSRRFR